MIAIVIRTVILYLSVTVGIRLMGKRQIGDLQPNELVVTLLISEIAAIPLQDMSQPIIYGVLSIMVLVILEILLSFLALKSLKIRRLISGRSVVVIKNGVIDQSALKDLRITVLDLIELLRAQNVFDISTVAFAVLEVNGNLSVLLKSQEQTVVVKDLGLEAKVEALPLPVICDGKIIEDSLNALEISINDIEDRAKSIKAEIKDIFLMTLDRNGNTNIIKTRN